MPTECYGLSLIIYPNGQVLIPRSTYWEEPSGVEATPVPDHGRLIIKDGEIIENTATEYPEYLPQVECQPYYQPKLPRNYKPDEDSMRRRGKLFSDIEQLGIKHNPDGSMEVAFKPQEDDND